MKINARTEPVVSSVILVIKDNAPLGLLQEIDTSDKSYRKPKWDAHGRETIEVGTYDRAVFCPDEHPNVFTQESTSLNCLKAAGIESLTQDEMDELRKSTGVVIR